MNSISKLEPADSERLYALLEQTTVLSDYRAIVGEVHLNADSLFHEAKPNAPPVVTLLHQILYEQYYCRLAVDDPNPAPEISAESFVEQLRTANQGKEATRSEWDLFSLNPTGQAFVSCGETIHLAEAGDFTLRPADEDRPIGIESVRFRTERISQETGFYFAIGQTPADALDRTLVSRIYFNLQPSDAVVWVREVTKSLNHRQMPFSLKCPLYPTSFGRSDSCVLYVPRRYLTTVLRIVAPIAASLKDNLRKTTPMFSFPLVPGVGLVDDPGTGESFGQHRMRIVASALWKSHRSGALTLAQKLVVVSEEFSKYGLRLEQAHLGPGAVDVSDAFYLKAKSL